MIDRGEFVRKAALNAIHVFGLPHLARPVLSGIGVILMLHRVTNAPGTPLGLNRHLSVTPDFLDATLQTVCSAGYEFVDMDEAVRRTRSPDHQRPFAAITLDDGYRDNLREALPVFEKHQAPFAIYIAPGLIDGNTVLWWDTLEEIVTVSERVEIPGDNSMVLDCSTARRKVYSNCVLTEHLTHNVAEADQADLVRKMAQACGVDADRHRDHVLMNWDEIITIADHPLCAIGSHTNNHFNLRRLAQRDIRDEIETGRQILEKRLSMPVKHLAYPYGYAAAVGQREGLLAAEAGHASAVSTRHGVIQASHAGHMHMLPRISINGRYQSQRYVRAMLSGVTGFLANGGGKVTTY